MKCICTEKDNYIEGNPSCPVHQAMFRINAVQDPKQDKALQEYLYEDMIVAKGIEEL